jgi:hypothetical protein
VGAELSDKSGFPSSIHFFANIRPSISPNTFYRQSQKTPGASRYCGNSQKKMKILIALLLLLLPLRVYAIDGLDPISPDGIVTGTYTGPRATIGLVLHGVYPEVWQFCYSPESVPTFFTSEPPQVNKAQCCLYPRKPMRSPQSSAVASRTYHRFLIFRHNEPHFACEKETKCSRFWLRVDLDGRSDAPLGKKD